MKKILFIVAIFAAMFASCDNDTTLAPSGSKTITIAFDGEITFEPFATRAVSEPSAMQDLFVFDYQNGQLVQSIHQQAGDDDFGYPTITLTYGHHDLYFVASAGTNPEVNTVRPSISWNTIGDTFWKSINIDVRDNTDPYLSVILNRVATALKVRSIDNVPATATCVTLQPDGWYNILNYTTGVPNGNAGGPTYTYDQLPKSQPLEITLYGFAADGYKNRVRIKTYSASGLIKESVAPNVPFSANHVTVVTGTLFGETTDATGINNIYCGVKVQDTWGANLDVEL